MFRKLLFLALPLLFFSLTARGQFYLKAGVGYRFGVVKSEVPSYEATYISLASNSFNFMDFEYDNMGDLVFEETVRDSYGKGGIFGISAGYFFYKNIGFELGFSYLSGGRIRASGFDASSDNYREAFETKANMVMFNPSLVLRAPSEAFSPYIRLGATVGFAKIRTTSSSSNEVGFEDDYEGTLSKGAALGVTGALGVSYALTPSVALFLELEGTSMHHAPRRWNIEKYTINGTNNIENRFGSSEKALKETITEQDDPDKTEIRSKLPFSGVGVQTGIVVHF